MPYVRWQERSKNSFHTTVKHSKNRASGVLNNAYSGKLISFEDNDRFLQHKGKISRRSSWRVKLVPCEPLGLYKIFLSAD